MMIDIHDTGRHPDSKQKDINGRADAKIFPKSRKLTLEQNKPLGWVQISKITENDYLNHANDLVKKSALLAKKVSPLEKVVNNKINELAVKNKSTSSETLRGKSLAKYCESMEDKTLQIEMVTIIKSKLIDENIWDEPAGKAGRIAKNIYVNILESA